MEQLGAYILTFVENGGLFAPILFIGFHLLRPLLFIPVIFICVSGGILFGTLAGTIYSLIGITLSSLLFYYIVPVAPNTFKKLIHLRKRLMNDLELTPYQIAFLRLIPFIHFHLLSLCLLEMSTNFKEYAKFSIFSNIPIAFVYTMVGQWVSTLSVTYMLLCLMMFGLFIIHFRRKENIVKWREFFQTVG